MADVASSPSSSSTQKGTTGATPRTRRSRRSRQKSKVAATPAKRSADDDTKVKESPSDVYMPPKDAAMVKKSPTPLETIFESGHKKKGALGKQKVRRKIESIDYWLEDKAKTRHRSKMTTKALQGRPRLMFCGLTEEQEKKLERLLSEQQEDSDAHEETAAGRDDSDVLSGLASTNHHVGESGAMLPEDELRRAIAEADAVFGTIGSTAASTKSRKKKGTGAPTERRDSVSLKVRRSLRILRRTVQVGGDDDVKDGSVYETTEMMVPEGRKGNLIKKLAVDAPRPRT